MGGPKKHFFQFYGGRDVKTPKNYMYLNSTQWDLQYGTHIDYQYSFGKNGRRAVKFFEVIIDKTLFDHNPGYFEYFTKLLRTNMCKIKLFITSLINFISSELHNSR